MSDLEFEPLKTACRQIGRELAVRRHEVVVGSLRWNTADLYVVEGMAEIEGKHKLTFYQREDETLEESVILTTEKFDVKTRNFRGNRHINALAEGMAMLVIGGQGGTTTAGFAAFALKRPVLALPKFGGAGKDIWDAVSLRYGQSLTERVLEVISAEWSPQSAKAVVDALESLALNNPFDDRIQRPQIMLTAAAIAMVIFWVILFGAGQYIDGWFRYPLFFMIIGIASVIGTLTRTFLQVYFDLQEKYSSSRLLSDFVLGIIMGFVFFLFMQVSGLVLTGDSFVFDASDFQRLAVLMSLVTLAAAFLLERSIDRFRERIGKYIEEEKTGGK